jgi:hypothetical protein
MAPIKDKIRYVITLPDGSLVERDSQKAYTHAVATQATGGAWEILGLYTTDDLARRRRASHQKLWPGLPCEVLSAVATVPLTERQRAFLVEIGDRTVEMFAPSHLSALFKRGLLARELIGMRWWRVRRTTKGRDAVAERQ